MKASSLALAVVMGLIFPGILFAVAEEVILSASGKVSIQQTDPTESMEETAAPPQERSIPVLLPGGETVNMPLEDYLVGVVLGEMPAGFEPEALKAQSVVARTYTLRRLDAAASKHNDGAVCTDPACCQAYCGTEEYLAAGNRQADMEKVRTAVAATCGEVLLYGGALIEATYFSCAGDRTEAAVAVWGTDVPYLQSVESPGEEIAAHYVDTVVFTKEEFVRRLGCDGICLSEDWLGETTFTQGGGVRTVEICGRVYKGTQVRQLLGLRSTVFQMTALGDTVTVTTKGYGHRVGMSQYGAQAMALQGCVYEEILAHYYPGTELESWRE